jgi:hypothetical protein
VERIFLFVASSVKYDPYEIDNFEKVSSVTYPEIWRSPYGDAASPSGDAVSLQGDAASP